MIGTCADDIGYVTNAFCSGVTLAHAFRIGDLVEVHELLCSDALEWLPRALKLESLYLFPTCEANE